MDPSPETPMPNASPRSPYNIAYYEAEAPSNSELNEQLRAQKALFNDFYSEFQDLKGGLETAIGSLTQAVSALTTARTQGSPKQPSQQSFQQPLQGFQQTSQQGFQ